jgi:hypothetical protein
MAGLAGALGIGASEVTGFPADLAGFWHVCPTCGLAGPVDAPDLFYCLRHGPLKRVAASDDRDDKAPDLHELIRKHGGYVKIPPEARRA